ncbi:hypothetical protein FB446DRAFT_708594 [Lentinula raphanica]|nr:hypothetical protein FB446DRAFT_708594 [Lentinula raphanica]
MVLSGEFGAEAYNNYDEEYFSERDDTEHDSEYKGKADQDDDHATSKSSNISSSPPRTTRLSALFEHIETRYVNAAGDFSAPSDVAEQLSNRVWLQGQDWPLWRVKCTPRQEYFLVYELMMRQIKHESLAHELRAVFYNPRHVGYLYLEAKFTESGIASLREVLREYSDIKLSSMTIVPKTEMGRCFNATPSDAEQVFAPGQWVQINKGLYRGDVGLVVDDYRDEASMRGVRVMVVPRLHLTDEDGPSSSKRKLPYRPPPQLFNPAKLRVIRHSIGSRVHAAPLHRN